MKVLSLASRNFKEIFRDPVTVLLGIAMPVMLMFLFSSLFERSGIDIFSPTLLTPGVVIFSYAFIIMFSAVLLAKDKQSSFLIRLFTTPMKPVDFILAYILPFLPFALFQTLVCMLAGYLLGAEYTQLLPMLGIYLMVALTCICLGVAMGALLTLNQISGVGSLLITVISIFSGAWMDLGMVGGVFETFGYALPFAHAVDAVKDLFKGIANNGTLHHLIIVGAYMLVFFLIAIFSFRRTMRKG
ncbi:MAG TPA: ABC transporter permease [Prolixibacteraceae bacterium]|nr:ABC transporter permease [Prolixibacteraceae bacterium]